MTGVDSCVPPQCEGVIGAPTQHFYPLLSPRHLCHYLLLPGTRHTVPTAAVVICILWATLSTLQHHSREGRGRAESF